MGISDIILGLVVGGYFIALGLGVKGVLPDNLRGNKFMLIFGALIIAGNFLISTLEKKVISQAMSPQAWVERARKQYNLPVQMDPLLRLETIAATNDRIVFNISASADTLDVFQKKIAEQRDYMQKNGCHMKISGEILRSGITVQMNYSAPYRLGGQEEQIILTPRDCGFMTPEEAAQQAAQKPAGK